LLNGSFWWPRASFVLLRDVGLECFSTPTYLGPSLPASLALLKGRKKRRRLIICPPMPISWSHSN
jgi:hypothetical protein